MNASGINFRTCKQKTGRRFFPVFLFILLLPMNVQTFAQVQNEVVITNTFANIRQGPAISYKLVGKAYKDERFPYVETRNGWYRIMFNNQIAWVYAQLARVDKVSNEEVKSLKRDVDMLDQRVSQIMDKIDTAISQIKTGTGKKTISRHSSKNLFRPTGR